MKNFPRIQQVFPDGSTRRINRVFIQLPGGKLKRVSSKIGGHTDAFDDGWGRRTIPEKTDVHTVGMVEEPDLLGFAHIPPARLVAASYTGNGHIVLKSESGCKYEAPLRHQAA